ncbi:MAG: hypothetical protein RSF40_01550 [Oscillospiraceae bacterium]
MTEVQERRYKAFLNTMPPMDAETAMLAATTLEPCYCIVSRNGNLVRQSMQCNDIAVLFKYRYTDGYRVQIFPASLDFKLPEENWRTIKEILKGLR